MLLNVLTMYRGVDGTWPRGSDWIMTKARRSDMAASLGRCSSWPFPGRQRRIEYRNVSMTLDIFDSRGDVRTVVLPSKDCCRRTAVNGLD
jgi:hypothetical protein